MNVRTETTLLGTPAMVEQADLRRIARVGSIITSIALCFFSVYSGLLAMLDIKFYAVTMVVGVIVGMLEIPFCCTCIDGCDKIAHSTRVCEHLVVRGLFYTLLGVGGVYWNDFMFTDQGPTEYMLLFISLAAEGGCNIAGSCLCKSDSGGETKVSLLDAEPSDGRKQNREPSSSKTSSKQAVRAKDDMEAPGPVASAPPPAQAAPTPAQAPAAAASNPYEAPASGVPVNPYAEDDALV